MHRCPGLKSRGPAGGGRWHAGADDRRKVQSGAAPALLAGSGWSRRQNPMMVLGLSVVMPENVILVLSASVIEVLPAVVVAVLRAFATSFVP